MDEECSTAGCRSEATTTLRFDRRTTFQYDYCDRDAEIHLEYGPDDCEAIDGGPD